MGALSKCQSNCLAVQCEEEGQARITPEFLSKLGECTNADTRAWKVGDW